MRNALRALILCALLMASAAWAQDIAGAELYSGGAWSPAPSTGSVGPLSTVTPVHLYCYNSSLQAWVVADSSCFGGGSLTGALLTAPPGAQAAGYTDSPSIWSMDDPNLGQTHQGNLVGALQLQNFYSLNSTYDAIAKITNSSVYGPTQLRIILNGDSTTQFHNNFIGCTLLAKFGNAGFDMGGAISGVENGFGQPCPVTGQTANSSTGTITQNNGAGSIVPGTGAPYDFTRSPSGVITNIASGGSVTYGSGGSTAFGNVLKVYYLTEPLDGITNAVPGTMTVTATSSATGPCPAGCVLFAGSLFNASSVGAVSKTIEAATDNWTITVAASGGPIDVLAIGVYDNTHNGIISSGGTGRGGLSLPDSVSTPTAITGPWYASATGAPNAITAYSITSNVITITAANDFVVGQKVVLGGFGTSTFLNTVVGTVLAGGLSSSQFAFNYTHANTSATEAGLALHGSSNVLIMFEMKQNGVVGGTGGCQQATTAAPTTFHPYSFWLGQYASQWGASNPLNDYEFVSSYDTNGGCAPVFNDQERQFAQQNGYFYFDNYFPATWAKLEQRGQLSDNVHSAANEQLAHSIALSNQMGFGMFLGVEQKPIATTTVAVTNLFLGNGTPNTSSLGVYNPSISALLQPNYAASKFSTDASLHTNWSVGSQLNIYDYLGTSPIFCIGTNANSGVFPAGCKITMDYLGHLILAGSTLNQLTIQNSTAGVTALLKSTLASPSGNVVVQRDMGASGAVALDDYLINGTTEWRVGLFQNTSYTIHDQVGGKHVLVFPVNTMPVNSITGNAAGAQLLTFQSVTNCSSAASPAVCAAAPSGSVVVAAAATTVVVNTTAVTAASQIQLQEDSSLGTRLSVTCNTAPAAESTVSARVAATSFTITTTAPTTNPRCFSYTIVN